MKKNFFYTVMMMAVMAVVTISFTACGGDDSDDPLENTSQSGTGTTNKEPCLDWGCDASHIKTYMGSSMNLTQEESHGTAVLSYATADYKYVINYLLAPTLVQVYVYHYDKGYDYFMKLISQYETRYQAKFEKYESEQYEAYGTNCTINGKYCGILIEYDVKTNTILVLFGLADK